MLALDLLQNCMVQRDYTELRLHKSLGNRTPEEFARELPTTPPFPLYRYCGKTQGHTSSALFRISSVGHIHARGTAKPLRVMSAEVYLELGVFGIYAGHNEWYEHYGDLFQPSDLIPEPPNERAEADETPYVLRKPFRHIVRRLELLGISEHSVRRAFGITAERNGYIDERNDEDYRTLEFETFFTLVTHIDVTRVDHAYVFGRFGGYERYLLEELAPSIGLALSAGEASSASEILEQLDGKSQLWLLAQNRRNLDSDVTWNFADHVVAGYSTTAEHLRTVSEASKVLVVTEGRSDGAILQKAFHLRRPEIADFFYYLDASQEAFPYAGQGNLRNFCRALISIRVLNQTIILFDNDAAGVSAYRNTAALALPSNIRVMTLPDLPAGLLFATVGPDGMSRAEINGRAAAIETYLDLSLGPDPRIRWRTFDESLGVYHGELLEKRAYAQRFFDVDPAREEYDFSKLDLVLDAIVRTAIEIAQARMTTG